MDRGQMGAIARRKIHNFILSDHTAYLLKLRHSTIHQIQCSSYSHEPIFNLGNRNDGTAVLILIGQSSKEIFQVKDRYMVFILFTLIRRVKFVFWGRQCEIYHSFK